MRSGKARHLSHQLFLSLLHKVKHGAVTLRGSYSYFPRSPLGTLGTMSPFWHAHEKKKKKEEKRNACLFRVSQLKQARLNIFRRYNETRFNDSEILQQFLQWNRSEECWDMQCIVGRIQPIRLCRPCVMHLRGPKNAGRAVQTDPALLRYASVTSNNVQQGM